MPQRPKGISDKYPPAKRAAIFSFMANNDGNVAKTCREFHIGRSTMDSLRKRYAHEIKEQQVAVKNALLDQAIADRDLAMEVLRQALRTQLAMLDDPKGCRYVRPSDIARSMDLLDKMIRAEGVTDAGQTAENNPKDESEVSKAVDKLIADSAEDTKD